MTARAPLASLRVLDLSRVLAGPFAGRMLADLGADVVKVEPPDGDVTRTWGDPRRGPAGYFTQQNAGKRSLCVNLEVPGGSELVRSLAAHADVLIENFRPGVMARHGLSFEALSEHNERLIMLSISGFGQTGPESQRAAYAPIVHAEAGLVARQAERDGTALLDPFLSIADLDAGLHGLVALLSALYLRERTGQGQHIDLAMLDAMLATDDYANFALDGIAPMRGGGEVWDAPGGPIMIAGHFRTIWRLLVQHGHVCDPAAPDAPRDEKIRLRRDTAAAFLRSGGSRAQLIGWLDAMNLAWGEVRTTEEAFSSPTVRARGSVAWIDDRAGGRRPVVQSPYRFSNAESGVRGPAAHQGEHNHEVLTEWMGASPDQIHALEKDGVLVDAVRGG